MKSILSFAVACLLIAPHAQSQTKPATRAAVTHEQLVELSRKAAQEDPMKNLPASKGADPSLVNQPKDLISQSDIICFGEYATLVPKRAILNLPPKLSDRLKFQPGAKIITWADFYTLNRGWITTVEVSRELAEGRQSFDEEAAKRIHKSSNLVVATFKGGPISVLPPKEPAENTNQNP